MPTLFWLQFGQATQSLGLALMIGGMLALGAFTAPALFKQLARPEAGQLMTGIFLRYDTVLMVALGLVVVGEAILWINRTQLSWTALPIVRLVALVGLVGTLLYAQFGPHAQMGDMIKSGDVYADAEKHEVFSTTHKQSEAIYTLQLLLASIILLLNPFIRWV